MSEVNRLPTGGRIDRHRRLEFRFDGRRYTGYQGDTLASALLANGVDIIGRSFKYSRPRGIVAAGMEEPNAIMQLGRGAGEVPNAIATQIELYSGLEAKPTNGWPSVNYDFSALADIFAPLLPPGFYNKTFMWPRNSWKLYEWFIRRMAGFGRSPTQADPDTYDKLNHHCEVLVIGAGPAGLAAARSAASSGARVIVVDEQSELGGSLLASAEQIDGLPSPNWAQQTIEALADRNNVTLLTRTTAFGFYDHNFVAALERRTDHLGLTAASGPRQRLHRIRAGQVILATGAMERMPAFANNDRPGVMLASAVSTYLHRYAVAPGQRMVLFASNDHAYQTALDWLESGRDLAAVIDPRRTVENPLAEKLRIHGVPIHTSSAVINVVGRRRVRSVVCAPISEDFKQLSGSATRLSCDLLAVSSGWSPTIHLSCHTGQKPQWQAESQAFLPAARPHSQYVGGINARYDLVDCVAEGHQAGVDAALKTGHTAEQLEPPQADASALLQNAVPLFLVPHNKASTRAPKQFVDFQNDVTAAAIQIAALEGYESIEHVKRYTALGFGTDQGKLGNVNGAAILADALDQPVGSTGTTIFRPAYTPTTFGAIAGRNVGELLDPERETAMHRWHLERGAAWENVGQWKRPWYYPVGDESMDQAVNRESLAVRSRVGILDASTLGKIDIQGPDAGEFLDRIYTNRFSNLKVGHCRYGMMLKEDGMVFDDGVVARLGDHHYLSTTTTTGAAEVLRWMELWLQTEWPDLQVYLTSVTDHWSTIALSGPNSRDVLAQLCDANLKDDDFPFMTWRTIKIAGVEARVFRISFTGELSFEINVSAHFGLYAWQACMEAGRAFDITPYGTETMHVLRAEKGFVIVGQDTDGSVTPYDLGMSWIINNKKPFSFIGKRSLSRSDTARPDRKHWVGLLPVNPAERLPEGGQLVDSPIHTTPVPMLGHVTSSYYSSTLGQTLALGFVKNGHNRLGDTVYCPQSNGSVIAAQITSTVFYDPAGERQNV